MEKGRYKFIIIIIIKRSLNSSLKKMHKIVAAKLNSLRDTEGPQSPLIHCQNNNQEEKINVTFHWQTLELFLRVAFLVIIPTNCVISLCLKPLAVPRLRGRLGQVRCRKASWGCFGGRSFQNGGRKHESSASRKRYSRC